MELLALSGIRYEGTLSHVDKIEKTMTLMNVITKGTEGRRNGINEIPS